VTCFHLVPDDPRLNFIKKASKYKNILLHTSAYITKRKLIELGVPEEKIIVIPLGVDLGIFKPVSEKRKKDLKRVLGILEGRIVIGSFQKDGVGWDEGLEPKLVKGPDIFIKVIEKLSKEYPIFVLLVGPSRGYVKKNLEKLRIPYKNIGYLSNYKEVAKYYHALDLYLITSRIEGGPKQILEAWASGVPVVTTKVGMVPDIARNGENALLAEVEDIQQITSKTKKIIENKELRRKLIMNGLKTVQSFSWGTIAKKYYEEIYLKLLKKRKS
jgi:glycosyltransferase involved in cell wall biosynthesis